MAGFFNRSKRVIWGRNRKAPPTNYDNSKGAKGSQDQKTLKEDEKRGRVTQSGGSSKENQGGKATVKDQLDSRTQTRDDTEPGAKGSQDQRTLKEDEKRGRVTQPGGSSKENQGGKATDKDQLDSRTQTRDDTEPGREEEAKGKSVCDQEKTSVEETGKQGEGVVGLRPKVIASGIEDGPRSRLSTNVLDIPRSIYRTVCIKLNSKREMSFNDFRMLGEKLGYDRNETRSLDEEVITNPTDALLDHWYKSDAGDATVEKLIQLLKKEDLKRMDVVEILEDWVQENPQSGRESTKVVHIPCGIYSKVCSSLNTKDRFFRDYRILGEKLGYDRDKISGFEQGSRDPTDKLIQMGFKGNGPLNVQRLMELLNEKDMKRQDVAQILVDWVTKGHV